MTDHKLPSHIANRFLKSAISRFGLDPGLKKQRSRTDELKKKFRQRHRKAIDSISNKHKDALKFLKETEVPVGEIGGTTARMLSAGALSGALLLGPVQTPQVTDPSHLLKGGKVEDQSNQEVIAPTVRPKNVVSQQLMRVLPSKPRVLTDQESAEVSRILKDSLKVNASTNLEGYRLNTDYGYMGYEQHLRRYPGDSAAQHKNFQSTGMAPGNGAWGTFVGSKAEVTPEVEKMEEYYWAVQSFLSPNWAENTYATKDWLKFRKMIAVNPQTGDAIVGVVGDAGPAVWTGKQFGGSPEAMHELKLDGGMRKGAVLLFFVDDPNNEIPLGPIYNY